VRDAWSGHVRVLYNGEGGIHTSTCSRQCVMDCCASWVGFSSAGRISTGRSRSLTATGLMSSVKEEEGRRRKWGWVDAEEGMSAEASNI